MRGSVIPAPLENGREERTASAFPEQKLAIGQQIDGLQFSWSHTAPFLVSVVSDGARCTLAKFYVVYGLGRCGGAMGRS